MTCFRLVMRSCFLGRDNSTPWTFLRPDFAASSGNGFHTCPVNVPCSHLLESFLDSGQIFKDLKILRVKRKLEHVYQKVMLIFLQYNGDY